MTRLIVYTPTYWVKSAGIHLLHEFAHTCLGLGVDCRTLCYASNMQPIWDASRLAFRSGWRHVAVKAPEEIAGAVVLYPEVIPDHPLSTYGPSRVVRWFLNGDGKITGQKADVGPDDVVWILSRQYHPTAPVLFSPFHDLGLFNMDGAQPIGARTLAVSYSGKTGRHVVPDWWRGPVEAVDRHSHYQWQWASLLKQARYLFCADSRSTCAEDALLCGCAPIITHWPPWTLEEALLFELPQWAELNRSGDYSPEAVEAARAGMVAEIERRQSEWPGLVESFVKGVL